MTEPGPTVHAAGHTAADSDVHTDTPARGNPTASYTVAALLAFLDHVRTVPGLAAKSIADIRSGTRIVLRHLNLGPDTTWNLETVNEWADAYADTPHADKVSPFTVRSYQDRLRTAARVFHANQTAQLAPATAPATVVPEQIQPSSQTLRDLKLLAAAWNVTPSEAITRLVDFYRHAAVPMTSQHDIETRTSP